MNDKLKELIKLGEAKRDLDSFRNTYPLFYYDFITFLLTYIDEYMINNGFSLKLRTVFRVFLEQCDETADNENSNTEINKIRAQLDELFIKHIDCYSKFAEMIRNYVFARDKGLGYSKLTRLILGEPALSLFVGPSGFAKAYRVCTAIAVDGLDEERVVKLMTEYFDTLMKLLYKIDIIEDNGDEIAS